MSIREVDDSFPFDKLHLSHPIVMSGGNHFIKFSIDGSPLYIKPPKCSIKGSISKTTKRSHCDLSFSNQDIDVIKWMEDLERHACKHIYENREKWFETDMELSDVENYFASPLKIYKSGKNYLVRTSIPTRLGKINLKIYNENEEEVDSDTITENTSIMTILEVQGIKCSARSFQIEFEIKQMLKLAPVDIFEKCILVKKVVSDTVDHNHSLAKITAQEPSFSTVDQHDVDLSDDEQPTETASHMDNLQPNVDEKRDLYLETSSEIPDIHANISNVDDSSFSDLQEFNVNLDDLSNSEHIQIKARNDVYYELYKEARKKARISRNLALQSYLEAREIKTKYDLDDIESDEEDKFYSSFLDPEVANQEV